MVRCVTSSPKTFAQPALGRSRVTRMRIVVVLPAPLGPSSPKTSPRCTWKPTPARARTVRKLRTSPSHSMASGLAAILAAATRIHAVRFRLALKLIAHAPQISTNGVHECSALGEAHRAGGAREGATAEDAVAVHQVDTCVGARNVDAPPIEGVDFAPDQLSLLEPGQHPCDRRRADATDLGERAGTQGTAGQPPQDAELCDGQLGRVPQRQLERLGKDDGIHEGPDDVARFEQTPQLRPLR